MTLLFRSDGLGQEKTGFLLKINASVEGDLKYYKKESFKKFFLYI